MRLIHYVPKAGKETQINLLKYQKGLIAFQV